MSHNVRSYLKSWITSTNNVIQTIIGANGEESVHIG